MFYITHVPGGFSPLQFAPEDVTGFLRSTTRKTSLVPAFACVRVCL